MSTKIYNGYRLPNWSLKEITNFCKALKDTIDPIRIELYSKQLAKDVSLNIDRYANGLSIIDLPKQFKDEEKFNTYHLDIAKDYALEQIRHIALNQNRNPAYDYEFSICFIPIKDKILALLYTEHKELTEVWENCQHVEEYGYWNNEEQDDGISNEEWEQRRLDWDEALPGLGIPAENGISFDPYKSIVFMRPSMDKLLKNIPTKDKRANTIAKELVWQKYYNDKITESDGNPSSFNIFWNFESELKTDVQLKYKFNYTKNIIREKLVTITKDYITTNRDFVNKLDSN